MDSITVPGSIYDNLHAVKYRGPQESHREACNRQAAAQRDSDEHYDAYRYLLLNQMYLPGGRVQAAMGSTRITTAYNCFVSGTIEDSFVHEEGNIMQRAWEAAATMRLGGGIGYDFSTLRPRGDLIKKLQSHTGGPIKFMPIYDAMCSAVLSAGHRRGAQMGILRVDHPDIESFIHCKQDQVSLTNFNISVALTHAFMQALKDRTPFELKFGGKVYREIDANSLWEMLMRSTWDWAEPGSIFIDTINDWNNLHWLETIAATNPCSEQPLPPFGACLLGSLNLVRFLQWSGSRYEFLWDEFKQCIKHIVRATDNVVDRTVYPIPQQEKEAKNKRRMGIGITALANTLEALGLPYASDEFLEMQAKIYKIKRDETYHASMELAKEKGAFPLFDKDRYAEGKFIQTLPEDLQGQIFDYGIRNSHLTSTAPTGTISITAGNVSSGIEPVFDYQYYRNIETFNGKEKHLLTDYGYRELGIKGKTQLGGELIVDDHLNVLAIAQKYTDSAVSKTCGIQAGYAWDDFKNISTNHILFRT